MAYFCHLILNGVTHVTPLHIVSELSILLYIVFNNHSL
nr:MAG TPA: hypothetical protein [Caudoviricetes sp.]